MKNGMESFFTREKANTGVEVPLYLPSGEKSEHHLVIRGVDSDVFRAAESESRRKSILIAQIPEGPERDRAIEDAKLDLIVSLVISWTFDSPCTHENVAAFLREAPQISDAIDRVASKRSLFFAQKSSSSENSLEHSFD